MSQEYQELYQLPMLLLIITITTIYASDRGDHRLAFQSNLIIATNVIVNDCFQSVID